MQSVIVASASGAAPLPGPAVVAAVLQSNPSPEMVPALALLLLQGTIRCQFQARDHKNLVLTFLTAVQCPVLSEHALGLRPILFSHRRGNRSAHRDLNCRAFHIYMYLQQPRRLPVRPLTISPLCHLRFTQRPLCISILTREANLPVAYACISNWPLNAVRAAEAHASETSGSRQLFHKTVGVYDSGQVSGMHVDIRVQRPLLRCRRACIKCNLQYPVPG
jgi:hypothetical protein